MFDLVTLVEWAVGLYLLLWAGGPFVLWLIFQQPFRPRFVPVPGMALPPAASRLHGDLVALGFVEVVRARGSDSSLSPKLVLLHHPTDRHQAMTTMLGDHVYLEFSTEFDDLVVDTNNSTMPVGLYERPPGHHVFQVPWVKLTQEMYRFHVALCRHVAPGRDAVLPSPDAALDHLSETSERQNQHQLGHRFLRRSGESVRFTLRGAARAAWMLIPPLPTMRRWRSARRTRKLLEAIGSGAGSASS